ncbi:MAG: transketolase family protein [Lachnospiraceae bacterium]|nr:transketolase family protein [Lachnospiraceae bacterium]
MGKVLATRMAFGQELMKIAKTNENFVVCSADTKTCGIEKFGQVFPGREFSFGIAEQNLVAGAAGLASCGNKVFLATFAVFASMRACEQVRTFICYPKLNVTVIGTHAGLQVGGDGATHAAIEDVAIMRSFPNMTVVQPADAISSKALAHAAVEFTGPLYIRLHRNPVADFYNPETYVFEWGKANTVVDYGTDMTFIVSGILLKKAVDAANILREQGIYVRVIDMSTIKPLDENAILKAAKETGAIMTIEDHTIYGGLGSAVSEVVVQKCLVPMEIVGIQDRFGESGDTELIYKDHNMDVDSIVFKAKNLFQRKRSVTLSPHELRNDTV